MTDEGRSGAGVGLSMAAIALAVVVVGLAVRPSGIAPGGPLAGSDASFIAPVSEATDDGTFQLRLTTPKATYTTVEAIEPVATVTYLGPDRATTISQAASPIGFRIEEVGGTRFMGGGMNLPCLTRPMTRDVAVPIPFAKGGSPDAGGFGLAWYEERVLRLPSGTWRIVAALDISLGNCGGEHHGLEVGNVIHVVGAEPEASASGKESTKTASTPTPSLSPEGAAAVEVVRKYLDGVATNHLDASWLLLSDWSKRSVGSFQTFGDGERRYAAARPHAPVVGPASRDPDLLDPAVLGARGQDLHRTSALARAWVVPIGWPEGRGAAGRTENVIVAPAGDTVRIWLDVPPGGYGAWPYPEGCAAFDMSARRCDFAVDTAAANARVDRSAATTEYLLPDPGCDQGLDAGVLCKRSGGFLAVVRFEFADRDPIDEALGCNVGSPQLLCSETPMLRASDMHDGYWDVTCGGEDPATCPSPIAVPTGAAAAGAHQLRIDGLDVAVGEAGHHELLVGTAVLPGGVLSEGRFSIPNSVEDRYLIDSDTVTMVLRSTEPGRPAFDNIYLRGVTDHAEAVDVFLVFDVLETSSGASFHMADLLVR